MRAKLVSAVIGLLSLTAFIIPSTASSATIFGDIVLDYHDSGTGPLAGPYGGTFPGVFPVPVPLSHATDGDATTFVSLPAKSYITLGFSGGTIFDGVGNDIFISEIGDNDELASIFVSGDLGATFTFLGQATAATVSGYDLSSIGFVGLVNAVRIVGLDLLGDSPGFDLAYVQGLEGSVISAVPLPPTAYLFGAALGGIGLWSRRRKKNSA